MKKILFIYFTLSVFFGISQENGFFGHKNYFDFSGLGNMRVFGLLFRSYDDYKREPVNGAGYLVKKPMLFDFGVNGSYNRMLKDNFAIGLEVGLEFKNIPGQAVGDIIEYEYNGNPYQDYINVESEALKFRTLTIMPKMTFCSKGSLLPIGISHEVGIGYTRSRIVEDDYALEISGLDYNYKPTESDKDAIRSVYVNYKTVHGGMTVLYGLKFRTPLSKTVLLNYGFRYTLNFRNYFKRFPYTYQYHLEDNFIDEEIGRARLFNFVTFNVGLSIAI